MNSIMIHYDGKPAYQIEITQGFDGLTSLCSDLNLSASKLCLVFDSNVAGHYRLMLEQYFADKTEVNYSYIFPAGEKNKNLDTVTALYDFLIRHHFERSDVLVAVGGGVTGDLTGFAAATYLRGIRFIQLPTSLLAMTDSSIGGKTGVDFKAYKNMVGAFHQPSAVYMNVSVLCTLPEREYISGLAEILKHGMIQDSAYLEWLCKEKNAILNREPAALIRMITRSCEIKKQVVENDPKELGERAILNFGHTIGHAVEKLMDFKLLHGECVSIGIAAAAAISEQSGGLSAAQRIRIEEILTTFGLPVRLPEALAAEDILGTTKTDKKMEHNQIKFILLNQLGEAYINRELSDEDILYGINEICPD